MFRRKHRYHFHVPIVHFMRQIQWKVKQREKFEINHIVPEIIQYKRQTVNICLMAGIINTTQSFKERPLWRSDITKCSVGLKGRNTHVALTVRCWNTAAASSTRLIYTSKHDLEFINILVLFFWFNLLNYFICGIVKENKNVPKCLI